MPAAPCAAEHLRLIPEDTLLARFFKLSPSALFLLLTEHQWIDSAGTTPEIRGLCTKLLMRLGPHGLVAIPSSRPNLVTECLVSIEVREDDHLGQTLTSLIEQATREARVPLSLRSGEVDGSQIFQLVSKRGAQTNLAFAIQGGEGANADLTSHTPW